MNVKKIKNTHFMNKELAKNEYFLKAIYIFQDVFKILLFTFLLKAFNLKDETILKVNARLMNDA